ncbi:MAG: hypothetical protein GY749_22505 [Desulfobacteraceae bacterium]|nr:hypothetical protein [Desulfobacteraceae bacterium]
MTNLLKFPMKTSISPEFAEILSRQIISEKTPGSILRDFETVLNFIITDRPGLTEKGNLLPLKALPKINNDLTFPLKFDLKRPGHGSYPNITGLYLLIRAAGLSYVERTLTAHTKIVPDEEVCMSWHRLNLTERYFTLLETWLFKAKPEILKQDRTFETNLNRWFVFFANVPSIGVNFSSTRKYEYLFSHSSGLYTITLMEMFGLIYVRHRNPEKGKKWRPESISTSAKVLHHNLYSVP